MSALPSDLKELLRQLGNPDWKRREEATRRLREHLLRDPDLVERFSPLPMDLEVQWRLREAFADPVLRERIFGNHLAKGRIQVKCSAELSAPQGREALDPVSSALSADGRYVAVACKKIEDGGNVRPGRLLIWDLQGSCRLTCQSDQVVREGLGLCPTLAFDPNSTRCGVAWGEQVSGYDPGSGKLRGRTCSPSGIWALAFDAQGQRLAAATMDGGIVVHDARTDKILSAFNFGKGDLGGFPTSIVFSSDGKRLAACSRGGALCLLDLETGKAEPLTVRAPGQPVALVFDADRLFVAGIDGQAAYVLDAFTGKEIFRAEENGSGICSLALSAGGQILLTGATNGALRLWDVPSRSQFPISSPMKSVRTVALSRDLGHGVAVDAGGKVFLFSLRPE